MFPQVFGCLLWVPFKFHFIRPIGGLIPIMSFCGCKDRLTDEVQPPTATAQACPAATVRRASPRGVGGNGSSPAPPLTATSRGPGHDGDRRRTRQRPGWARRCSRKESPFDKRGDGEDGDRLTARASAAASKRSERNGRPQVGRNCVSKTYSLTRRMRNIPGMITAKERGSSSRCSLTAKATISALRKGATPARRISTTPCLWRR